MIALLSDLVRFLSREPLTVADVVAKVGPIRRDPGGSQPIDLEPRLPGVRAARLLRLPETGAPYTLTLDLEVPIAVASLRAGFGDFRPQGRELESPRGLVFYPPAMGERWTVAMMATIPPGSAPTEGESAGTITLRRDRR